MFHFPLGFAPDIAYQGIEDARFPVGWSKKDSSTFWSYVFAWHIEGTTLITEKDLESNLQIYFDGLMNAVNRDTSIEVPGTTALFLPKENTGKTRQFVGKVRVFNAFHTKKMMTLNVQTEVFYCADKKTSVILYRFSPKEFGSAVWEKISAVKFRAGVCDF